MSTTYFIRTFNCEFPSSTANATSRNQVLIWDYDGQLFTSGVVQQALYCSFNLYHTGAQLDIDYLPYKIMSPRASTGLPTKDSYANEQYLPISSAGGGYFNTSPFAYSIPFWENKGWTASNITTFKTELCTWFETIKTYYSWWYGELGYLHNWGTDNGEINMHLFRITFDDLSPNIYTIPLFYKGNDPQAQETIVI